MATGPTNYKFKLNDVDVDFFDVFETGSSGIITGYKIGNGQDLGQLFRTGNSEYTTGYKYTSSTGAIVDLGSIFERKLPFTVTGASIYGTTARDSSGFRYCYAIFTNIDGNVYKSATVQQDFTSMSITCVGGGGGGGGSSDTRAPGGGGGGAVQKVDLIEIEKGTAYAFLVGAGGAGGIFNINNGAGGNGLLSLFYNVVSGVYMLSCYGGTGGNNDVAGIGGLYAPGNISTGSNGGRASAGQNCTYTNPMGFQSLDFPAILKNTEPTYICDLYAGGGGGTKTSSVDTSYTGGGGGQAPNGISNGAGGVRGSSNLPGTSGIAGQGWGSGGGAGGFTARDTNFNGAPGKQGIVIVYSPIQ